MNYDWLDGYLLEKPGAEKEHQPEWQATKYMLRGKMFVMIGGDKQEKPIATFKLEPAHGELLRQQYKEVVPGYYMNKTHWNSLYLEGSVPDDVVMGMADEAYRLVLASLPKKVQREILPE